jgi:hypothetical protein
VCSILARPRSMDHHVKFRAELLTAYKAYLQPGTSLSPQELTAAAVAADHVIARLALIAHTRSETFGRDALLSLAIQIQAEVLSSQAQARRSLDDDSLFRIYARYHNISVDPPMEPHLISAVRRIGLALRKMETVGRMDATLPANLFGLLVELQILHDKARGVHQSLLYSLPPTFALH